MKQANKIRSKTLSMGELIIEFDRFFAEGGLKRSLEIVKGDISAVALISLTY